MTIKFWTRYISILVILFITLLLPLRMIAEASDTFVSISIDTFENYQDEGTKSPDRHYYLSWLMGTGTPRDAYRPIVAIFTNDFGMFDLRPDRTKVDGWCFAYTDGIGDITNVPGLLHLQSGLTLNDTLDAKTVESIESAFKVKAEGASLPEIIFNISMAGEIVTKGKPQTDGDYRINLGGQIYGRAPPVTTHTTINDTFNRADADALGNLSDGSGAWVEELGDIDIVSNQADIQAGADGYARANTADPATADHYAQANYTHGTEDGGGVAIRYSSSADTFYAGGSTSYENFWAIWEVTSGSWSTLDSEGAGWSIPSAAVFYMEGNGSSLTLKVDGATKCTASDASISNFDVGIVGWDGNTSLWDNFEGSDLSATPNISNTPSSKAFGIISGSSTYYFKGSAPSNPVQASETTFTVTNNTGGSQAVDLYIRGTNWIGTSNNLTLTSSAPGTNQIRETFYCTGDDPANGVILTTSNQLLKSSLADSASLGWDGKVETGTWNGPGTIGGVVTQTITITAQIP
jgi:hypothetical protein